MSEYTSSTGRSRQRQAILRSFYWSLREGNNAKANRIKQANADWISFKEFDAIAGKVMSEYGNRSKEEEAEEASVIRSISRGTTRECES